MCDVMIFVSALVVSSKALASLLRLVWARNGFARRPNFSDRTVPRRSSDRTIPRRSSAEYIQEGLKLNHIIIIDEQC